MDQAVIGEKLQALQKSLGYVGYHMCPHCKEGFLENDYYSPQTIVNRINIIRARLAKNALDSTKSKDIHLLVKVEKAFIGMCQEKEYQRSQALLQRLETSIGMKIIDSLNDNDAYITMKLLAVKDHKVTVSDFDDLPGVTEEDIERGKEHLSRITKEVEAEIFLQSLPPEFIEVFSGCPMEVQDGTSN